MPNISERAFLLPYSPIRKLSKYATDAKAKGIKVFHLNIGQPDVPTLPAFLEAIKQINLSVLDYSPSEGILGFRQKLSQYYKHYSLDISADQIITTIGASEGLLMAFNICMNEGDEIIIPEPSYSNYYAYAHLNKCKVVSIPTHIRDNFALPSIEKFKEKITPKTRAILISNPNNPTGYVYTQEEILSLKELAIEHDLFILSDEAYREFCYDGTQHISIMSIKGLERHSILLDSISKRYSACGARLGMLISKNEEFIAQAMKYAQMRLSPPTLEQEAAAIAFSEANFSYLKEANVEFTSRRNLIISLLRGITGTLIPEPKGAFYVTVELPIDDSEKFCRWLLEDFSYNNATVMLAPASGFYGNPELGKKQVRIAYVLNKEDITKAIECLAEGLKAYPNCSVRPS